MDVVSERRNYTPITLVILWATIILVRLQYILIPYPDLDQAEAVVHALRLLAGGTLYADSYTHHHPGSILLSLGIVSLCRNCHLFTNLLSIIFSLITASVLFLALLRCVPVVPALLASLICGVAFFPHDFPLYPQHITSLFLALQVALFSGGKESGKRNLTVAALIAGLAFVCDQRAALLLLPVLTALLFEKSHDRTANLLPVLLGFVAPIAVFFLSLLLTGAWGNYLEQCWIFPLLGRTGGYGLTVTLETTLRLHKELITPGTVLALGGITYLILKKLWREAAFWLICGLSVFLMATAGNQAFLNYLIPWYVVLPALSAYAFKWTIDVFGRPAWVLAVFLPITAFGGPLFKAAEFSLATSSYFVRAPDPLALEAASYIRQQMGRQDDVYLWGYQPQFYLYLGRLSTFRHVNQHAITGAYFDTEHAPATNPVDSQAFEEFRTYMQTKAPSWFVIHDNPGSWKTYHERIIQAAGDPKSRLHKLASFIESQLSEKYQLRLVVEQASPKNTKTNNERFLIYKAKLG